MEIPEESQNIQIQTYLTTFSLVILFYDHALTFEREVAHIWSQPWIKSSTIFLVNRYLAFFSSIATLVLAHKTTLDPHSCHAYSLWHQLMLIICQILVCIIVSLRIYALYNCSKRVMWFLILFAALLTGVVAWSMTDQQTVTNRNGTTQECRLSVTFETSVRLSLCWVALFAYDSTLFGLTMYKTWKSKLYRSLTTSGSVPILTLLLRDGAVYFMLMALVNMSNILTFYFAPAFLRGSLSTFSSALSTTLVSRMMLNLHCAHAQEGVLSTVTGLMFADRDNDIDPLDTMVEVELPLPYHQKATESSPRIVFMARP